MEKVCGESSEGHSSRRDKSHENCLQDTCLCLLHTISENLRNKSFPTAPLRQPPNTSRRDKSHENCLQDICLCLLYTSYLKILCRSHVSHSCLSIRQYGSSIRSTSSDSCLSIHMYLRLLCKIRVSGSMAHHPYVSQDPLQDPCLRIHISASVCISGSSARSMSPTPVSASLYLRVLCNIHVSGSMSQHPYVSQDPLQDPCLRIHVSASLYLRVLCNIHVSGSMSQHPYVPQDPLQDPCLRIHVSDSGLGILMCGSSPRSVSQHSYLWILYKIDTALQRERLDTRQSRRGLRGCNQNRHRATTRAIRRAQIPQRVARALIQHAERTERVARTKSKSAPRYTARAIRHARTAEGCAPRK